jgi:glycosyltransferase involved in cell wall biosynthesis
MILSVVIPAYNEENYIAETIENIINSIEHQNIKQSDWEIIMCNNNSSDKTAEIAKGYGVKVVFEPENQISKARNTGAKIAQGDWLLFLDADTYPNKDLMTEIVKIVHEGSLIGCGTTVKVIDGSLFNKLRMERLNPFFRLFKVSGGAFILSQKQGFDSINGFSENLYAYEEFDFIIRLKRYGRSIGKRFKVLYKNPVITSGRKGAFRVKSLGRLIFSNFIAIVLFILHYILPSRLIQRLGKKLLSFWYRERKNQLDNNKNYPQQHRI